MLDLLSSPGTIWLDTARTDEENRAAWLFTNPHRIVEAFRLDEVPDALIELDRATTAGHYAAGYVAYEAALGFLPVKRTRSVEAPLVWFGIYEAPVSLTPEQSEDLFLALPAEGPKLTRLRFSMDQEGYHKKVQAVRAHIREGDVYQVNFTGAVDFAYTGTALALYRALRQRQRVPYGAFLNAGDRYILSFSPELFFRRAGERLVAQPMKGTIRRGRTPSEDEGLADELARDEKNRAENLMIVDLLRNDLSVVCRPGSVHVPHLFATTRYETLTQMTSTVEGTLHAGVTCAEILQALFPCGSVTGAPKVRAMQIIHDLEERARGVYCGAIGYVAPEDKAVFNVAIRTLVLEGGHGTMGVGSGIVWDSDPDAEYREVRLKASFLDASIDVGAAGESKGEGERTSGHLHPDFDLIETMRYGDGIPLLDLHLDRLRRSAQTFEYPFDEAELRAWLIRELDQLDPGQSYRVRVTLNAAGRLTVTTQRLPPDQESVRTATIAGPRVDSRDVFLYHKTTRRELFESTYQRVRQAGFDEAIFLNERGEVTEGSRSNVFVRKGGRLYTPPVSSGLLAGVYRRHVLETTPEASEQVLHPEDLQGADAVYLCNAVWGLVEVAVERTFAPHGNF